jgi:D-arabinose 1-dehydrogenase-like Zn-dependent alcohol dehydrogenase
MATMKAVQIPEQGGDFEVVEREIPTPGAGEVRVKVSACGVCHSDMFAKEGGYNSPYPIVPGHEIAGVVDLLGAGVEGWTEGQRVGVGWFGGNCGYCEWCRRGWLLDCTNMQIPGVTMDGGYAEYGSCGPPPWPRCPTGSATRTPPRCCAPA